MRLLLDTCAISEVSRPGGSQAVRHRIEQTPDDDLFLSVVTLGELVKGISLLRASRKKRRLTAFVDALERDFGDRILPIDAEVARIWGELTATARRRGRTIGACDGLIAATAIRHGLVVVTRNVADFEHSGARIDDPWSTA